jgi:ABC-2 type transport system ATP-binding protein
MREAAIAATDLTIIREGVMALDQVSCEISRGGITGLIGPSGSGKTTLMRAIIGAQEITSGVLSVLGLPAGDARLRATIGYVSQAPSIYDDLTVRQNLEYFAVIVQAPSQKIYDVLDMVDLAPQAGRLVRTLSGGQRARVSLAIALLGDAELLILDEPTVGLDPLLRKHLWELFHRLADEGRSLLISSHVMDEAEECPRLLLLREGKVLKHDTKQSLLAATHTRNVHDAFLRLIEQPEAVHVS